MIGFDFWGALRKIGWGNLASREVGVLWGKMIWNIEEIAVIFQLLSKISPAVSLPSKFGCIFLFFQKTLLVLNESKVNEATWHEQKNNSPWMAYQTGLGQKVARKNEAENIQHKQKNQSWMKKDTKAPRGRSLLLLSEKYYWNSD